MTGVTSETFQSLLNYSIPEKMTYFSNTIRTRGKHRETALHLVLLVTKLWINVEQMAMKRKRKNAPKF